MSGQTYFYSDVTPDCQEYPWPSGKAPWSIERGGTGIPPDRARENWGRNRDFSDHKPVILNVDRKPAQASGHQRSGGLPAPGEVRVPRTQAEAVRMLELSQRLMQVGCQFLGPSLSDEVRLPNTKNEFLKNIRL